MSTRKKLSKYARKASDIYAERGIKGLEAAATSKLMGYALPTVYKNPLLNKVFYPKLKVVYLELTNKCNLSCKMCTYKVMQEATGYMSKSLFESCVNQLSQIGIDVLILHFGGESLVHPDFRNYLKYAIYHRDHGGIRSVCWTDNGMLFSQAIADLVVDLQVDLIAFSIDGVGEVNDKIRLGAKYSVIEKNIKYLIGRRGNAKKPFVRLSVCDFGKTEEQKMDVYREWVPFVDSINLIPSILPDNTLENKDEINGSHKLVKPPAFCPFPFDVMAVSWDGKVTGCCLDYVFKMNLGNATQESLKQIWRGPRYQALREAALKNIFPAGSPCYKCEFWQLNFEPTEEAVLDGKAIMKYGYLYRTVESPKKKTERRTEV